MGQPSALHNRTRQWINGIELVEPTDVKIASPQPVGQKFGPKGLIGNFKGQAGGRVNITFAQVSEKSQFDTFARAESDFVYVFTKGSQKFVMTNCEWGDADMSNAYESGDTTLSSQIIGAPIKAIS